MQSVIMHISADLRSEIHCRRSLQRIQIIVLRLISLIHITHSGSLLSVSVSHLSSAHHQSSVSAHHQSCLNFIGIVRSGGRVSVSVISQPHSLRAETTHRCRHRSPRRRCGCVRRAHWRQKVVQVFHRIYARDRRWLLGLDKA